jgi:GNAT superfamily N-acetyltransferase
MSDWKKVPWDARAFRTPVYEAKDPSREALAHSDAPGIYVAKVDPLRDRSALHSANFYYCDTLIEPYCRREDRMRYEDVKVRLGRKTPLKPLLEIANGAFAHGRFHRDFRVERTQANRRYSNWLKELHRKGRVTGLYYGKSLAGFIAEERGRLVLHALSKRFRGRGLAKYFWSAALDSFFAQGRPEITSSISAANTAALSLYASLGFRFRNAVHVYHKRNPAP